MNQTVVALLLFCLIIKCAYISSLCTEDVKNYIDCVNNVQEKQQLDVESELKKQRSQEVECFTKNKCKEPSFEKSASVTKNPILEKRKQCRKMLTEKGRNITNNCVQSKSGIIFPDTKLKKKKTKETPGLINQVRKLCTDDKTSELVFDCFRDVHNKSSSERASKLNLARKHLNEICSKKTDCLMTSMSEECRKKFNSTGTLQCDCAKSELKPKEKEFNDEFFKCVDIKQNAENDEIGYEVEDLIIEYCTQVDQCQTGYDENSQRNN